jgi:hypothetical protein
MVCPHQRLPEGPALIEGPFGEAIPLGGDKLIRQKENGQAVRIASALFIEC